MCVCMYICMYVCIYIFIYIYIYIYTGLGLTPKTSNHTCVCSYFGTLFGLYKILLYLKTFLWESIIFLLPPHLQRLHHCNTIARLAQYTTLSPDPRLYVIHHTILVMAILCKANTLCA